jgi:hypothetical protein
VIDAMMGSGKTTYIFDMMRRNPQARYLYISLFLDEVGDGNRGIGGRVQQTLPELDFKMPRNIGDGKLEYLKGLVRSGNNISSTHALFGIFDEEVVDLLVDNNYTLVIDEAVDCIGEYGEVNEHDIRDMLNAGMVSVGSNNKLSWNEEKYPEHNGKYGEVREYCRLESLYLFRDKVLIWEYPPKLLQSLGQVFIVSYLFEGSVMSCWMKANGIDYSKVDNTSIGLSSEVELKQVVRDNLQILRSTKLDKEYTERSFGVNWFKTASQGDFDMVKSAMEQCVKNTGCRAGEVFWTCFKAYRAKIAGRGYSKPAKGGLDPFLPCNTKATNNYRDYKLCMYPININKRPTEISYLSERGVEFNKDLYALSEMIQFIWRGCIRKGEPMKVLVASKRMRKLLEDWLNE